MSQANQSLDLSALEQDYEIVGEVTGQSDARTYAATRKVAGTKRRGDTASVLISVFTKPDGDEGNALSHLAADVKLLAANPHRRLIPIVEGRWLGERFAVITERTADASLAQLLDTGERFATTRTAAILRELSGLLEWARDHNVVNRAITANRVFVEPKTDRVRVTFGVTSIPRIQRVDGATEDARTIVKLALAMLTGREDPAEYGGKSLAELRPDLPSQLRDATADMLDPQKPRTVADVTRYISLIGMAEPLGVGENEASRIRAETLGEQLAEREKLFNERVEFDRTMREERANFEKLMADKHASFEHLMAEERAKFAKIMEDEREAHAKQKAELQAAVTAERAALVALRESLERAVANQRAELERAAADDRARIEALRAELRRAGELEVEKKRDTALDEMAEDEAETTLDREDLVAPLFVTPTLGALDEFQFDDDNALMRDDDPVEVVENEVVVAQPVAEQVDVAPADPAGSPVVAANEKGSERPKWLIPGALAGLALLISASAIALRYSGDSGPAADTARAVAATPPAAAPAALAPAVPLPSSVAIIDSSAGRLASREGVPDVEPAPPPPRPRPRPRPVVQAPRVVDSAVVDDVIFRDASPVRRDTVTPPRRDTLVRRDSVIRPDTIPR